MHLVTHDHFWSHDKDGDLHHSIRHSRKSQCEAAHPRKFSKVGAYELRYAKIFKKNVK